MARNIALDSYVHRHPVFLRDTGGNSSFAQWYVPISKPSIRASVRTRRESLIRAVTMLPSYVCPLPSCVGVYKLIRYVHYYVLLRVSGNPAFRVYDAGSAMTRASEKMIAVPPCLWVREGGRETEVACFVRLAGILLEPPCPSSY